MKWLKLLSLALCYMHVTGCAHSDPWDRTDTALYVTYVGTLAYDGHTTSEIQDYPCISEDGPIAKHVLGANPSTSDTWQYLGTLAISNYFIARALPSGWRKFYLGVNALDHGYAAHNNDRLFNKGC